jgi:hypothetical protein
MATSNRHRIHTPLTDATIQGASAPIGVRTRRRFTVILRRIDRLRGPPMAAA